MTRKSSDSRAFLSPVQIRAIVTLMLCTLAGVLTFFAAWLLPGKLNLGGADNYDKEAYPLDTTLGSILPPTGDAGVDYIAQAVFAGDQYTVSLQNSSQITLNQFVGQSGLKTSQVLNTACVNFVSDSATYTVPQAIAMMKPRRIVLTLGSNDADGSMMPDLFIQDYRQLLSTISSAYPYCDIIVNSVPPVLKSGENSAERQFLIDQFNQKLAALCVEMGFKFLNSAEVLKNELGYAEETYFEKGSGGFSASGVNTLLTYVRTHAWQTEDQRPDTENIPQRASSASSAAAPTPTPLKHTVYYEVENQDITRGSVTGNGETNQARLQFEADNNATVSVTAVPATGYTFYKWSDGQTSATRYDVVTQDISVTAMFNDARVDLTLNHGDTTMKKGESLSVNATVKLGGKEHDNSGVQWSVNDDLQMNGGTFTFTPTEAGTYVVRAGIEINGTFKTAEIKVTVTGDPTTVSISGPGSLTVGNSTTLTASVENSSGDTTWSCDQTSWTATGNQVQFTAYEAGSYTIRAKNNGVTASFTLTVTSNAGSGEGTDQPPASSDPEQEIPVIP